FSEKSNNSEDVNIDFLEELNYSQEDNNINFSEEFISDNLYLEYFTTISSESSNNLTNSLLRENSDELDILDELNESDKLDELNELSKSDESDELDKLFNNKFFKKIVDKALNFEKLLQNTNEFSPHFKNLTAVLLFY
ncbi:8176_t:CDS:1, partial [Scutellospora calospora]